MLNPEKIIAEFNRIRNLGYISSNRTGNTGIGKTFEDHLGVIENNVKDPDFDGFEVKSQRTLAKSPITLFTKSPTHPANANEYLKQTFGKPDNMFPQHLVLHPSIFTTRDTLVHNEYRFRLVIDNEQERITIVVKDIDTGAVINDSVYYAFCDIQLMKLYKLFVVWADTKVEDGQEYFHFTKAKIYYGITFDKLLEFIESGLIQFDIRFGVYKSGKLAGRKHDHGSGFRLKKRYLSEFFENTLEID